MRRTVAWPLAARAQQSQPNRRIGILMPFHRETQLRRSACAHSVPPASSELAGKNDDSAVATVDRQQKRKPRDRQGKRRRVLNQERFPITWACAENDACRDRPRFATQNSI